MIITELKSSDVVFAHVYVGNLSHQQAKQIFDDVKKKLEESLKVTIVIFGVRGDDSSGRIELEIIRPIP